MSRRSGLRVLPADSQTLAELAGVRVATSYPGLVGAFLNDNGVAAELVALDGAVESAVRLGVADAVADVVSTGSTLRAQGLEIFGPVILESSAVLISAQYELAGHSNPPAPPAGRDGRAPIRAGGLRRAGSAAEAKATAMTPGIESPTFRRCRTRTGSRCARWCPRADTNHVMDELYEHRGARDPGHRDPRGRICAMALAVRVIPCLDVAARTGCQGRELPELRDAGDPVELARRYYEQGADEITFLDVTATVDDRATDLRRRDRNG